MKYFVLIPMLFLCTVALAQNETTPDTGETVHQSNEAMKTYVIERVIPGAGDLTAAELKGISQVSCSVIEEMGPAIAWQHSYVTGDKVYCVYEAKNKKLIEEHAKKGNFPANSITEVSAVISPKTANQ